MNRFSESQQESIAESMALLEKCGVDTSQGYESFIPPERRALMESNERAIYRAEKIERAELVVLFASAVIGAATIAAAVYSVVNESNSDKPNVSAPTP